MALDGLFLNKLVNELKHLKDEHIGKIYQIGKNEFIFQIAKEKLLISLERNSYRVSLTDKEYQNPKEASTFCMVLRKYFESGKIIDIYQYNLDRILTIEVLNKNELNDKRITKIIIELMGKNSNLIITDQNDIIIDAFKKIGVSVIGRTILPKAKYIYPDEDKLNIYEDQLNEDMFSTKKVIIDTFYGLSPLIINHLLENNDPIKEINKLQNECHPTIFKKDNKTDFYFYPLGESIKEYQTLSLLLEDFYFQKTIDDIKSNKFSNLKQIVLRELKKQNKKLESLDIDLSNSNNNLIYKKYANLIKANLYQYNEQKLDKIALYDYENNEEITIELDKEKSVKDNMFFFYQLAKKALNSLEHINKQKEITNDKIAYFNLILTQIDLATVAELEDIYNELKDEGIIRDNKKANKTKKKKIELTNFDLDGIKIYIGKNNLQNDYLTNHLAKSNYMWFHVKDAPGSHVVIFKEGDLTEKEIRFCANLAAKYSYYKDSSSVPVIYTLIKYIKKIPGKMNCFVNYSNEKTIYIDPSE